MTGPCTKTATNPTPARKRRATKGMGEAPQTFRAARRSKTSPDLFTRLAVGGLEALDDAGTLAMLIGRSTGVNDSAAAEALLRRFGGLQQVLSAAPGDLTSSVGPNVAIDLRLIYEVAERIALARIDTRTLISSSRALHEYLKLTMANRAREVFRILFLDKRNALIADEETSEGTVDQAAVYTREVMRRALELGASAIILVHNHPSGDPSPSRADVDMTREIHKAAQMLQIALHDHLVVGRDGVASFKALGLI